ncbi:GNAT family N-acetyltransferase [Rhodobacteraceae bacterium]|nr:GNAT family N-acetyltransferase [Paracoccaceae bacterium]
MPLTIEYADPKHPEITALLQQSHALMLSLYSDEENYFLSIDALCAPHIRFFGAQLEGRFVGCGALALMDGYGELKSMFTDPSARGKGVAKSILAAIESEAQRNGLDRIALETGWLLKEAVALYRRLGFQECGPFGNYPDSPASLFMAKDLAPKDS